MAEDGGNAGRMPHEMPMLMRRTNAQRRDDERRLDALIAAEAEHDRVMDGLRDAVRDYFAALKGLADPDCRICKGKGVTDGYISPGTRASDPCPCTGRAAWQRGPGSEGE